MALSNMTAISFSVTQGLPFIRPCLTASNVSLNYNEISIRRTNVQRKLPIGGLWGGAVQIIVAKVRAAWYDTIVLDRKEQKTMKNDRWLFQMVYARWKI